MKDNKKASVVWNLIEDKITELKEKNSNFSIRESVGWVIFLTYK